MSKRNEVSYYPELMKFIKNQIESNFKASKNPLKVYCKTGELKKGLAEIISENGITTPSIISFANNTPPLSLDIFALITDGIDYELLIIEVKLLDTDTKIRNREIGSFFVTKKEERYPMAEPGTLAFLMVLMISTNTGRI